jgi:hypothetical protein
MTDRAMSRRDWFRLRKLQDTPSLETTAKPPEHSSSTLESLKATLSPVPQPPNHDGMDLRQLPPLSEAELSHEQIADLFSDITQLGSQISLMHHGLNKWSSDQSTADAIPIQIQLQQALANLLSGKIGRVQVRYQWDHLDWIDTLQSQNGSFRLVRICHPIRSDSVRMQMP